MRSRSWRWLSGRVSQLLTVPPIVAFEPDGEGKLKNFQMPATRIGFALKPPEWR